LPRPYLDRPLREFLPAPSALRVYPLPRLRTALRTALWSAIERLRRQPLLPLGVVLPALAAGLVAVACQRHLTPPPVSYKPPHYRAAAIAPTPLWPREEPNPASLAPPAPGAPGGGPEVQRASLRPEPSLPPPAPARPFYDAQQPCFSTAQMERARGLLFKEDPGPWGDRWLHAINAAFYTLHVPCEDDGFLVLVLTTIQLESAVTVDPGLENSDLDALFTFHLRELRRTNPVAGRLLDYSGLDEAMHAKLRADTRKGLVRTEGELVRYVQTDLRAWLRGWLHTHYFVPEAMARYAAEQGLPNPVHTIGPMQVNLHKAYENARSRGEAVASEDQMREWLLSRKTAMERGIEEGVFQLWRIYRFYRRYLPPDEAVRYTTADYNAGEFSSRNAAFQQQVEALTGRRLALDGDLLSYQNGEPAERVSNTEAALILLLNEDAAPNIRQDLLLEKTAAFSSTRTARMVCARYRQRTGRDCVMATLPVGALNPAARVKLGRDYTPVNYSRAYVKRWSENLARFEQG
jgi:Protein of unknown function (DUF1615)